MLPVLDAISNTVRGSKPQRFRPFSCQLARRDWPFGVLDRGARLADLQGDAAARIARAGQAEALGQRHRPAIDLQMRALVVLEKSDNELGAVGAAIVLERLRQGRRRRARNSSSKQCRAEY